jgi:FdhE protein
VIEQAVAQAVARLDALSQTDPAVVPLARLQAEALRAAADATWAEGVPEPDRQQIERGIPLLHRQTVRADGGRVRRLLARLAAVVRDTPGVGDDATAFGRAVEQGDLDAASLLRAALVQDGEALAHLAGTVGVDVALLATIANLAALPLLQACGRRADPVLGGARWTGGYCPVCAAWPTLAELRGLDRMRWLRCGRCGSGWSVAHVGCPYCSNADRRSAGYLAPERERESRRAVTCDVCRGYLKTVTTIQAIPPVEIGMTDMQTLELDVAALDQDYARPDVPGFPLDVTVEVTERRSRWTPWHR